MSLCLCAVVASIINCLSGLLLCHWSAAAFRQPLKIDLFPLLQVISQVEWEPRLGDVFMVCLRHNIPAWMPRCCCREQAQWADLQDSPCCGSCCCALWWLSTLQQLPPPPTPPSPGALLGRGAMAAALMLGEDTWVEWSTRFMCWPSSLRQSKSHSSSLLWCFWLGWAK